MDFLSNLPAIGGTLGYLVPFLFVLTLVVFIHELGHFMVARWCGVKIDVFSIGFGRELFGFYDRHGTRWKFSWLLLGGYVKFHGDMSEASTPDRGNLSRMSEAERAESFHFKPLWQRAAIVAAGPFANFLLTIVIFAGGFMAVGQYVSPPRVDGVAPGSAAERAGFEVGDVIVSVDGAQVESFSDVQRIVVTSGSSTLTFVVDRAGAREQIVARPDRVQADDGFGNTVTQPRLGIQHDANSGEGGRIVRYDPVSAVWMGVEETWFIISNTISYVGRMISGTEETDQLGGPIRIAKMSGDVAQIGFLALLNLAAIISASIGLINLFPVPLLDGGHLLFYAFEAVRGKPLGERAQEMGFKIGLVLVLSLMVFATWNDFVHLRVFDAISSILS
ncbi:MAG: RIP metalloprotease RseP [Alphaproteobacteria bacterium]|nr:RIP metalloprotease RseP [Alphaproteobacteria bacterium]MDX5368320.1 RIP metalloprotease RseP [Alphaproteobacteria bacterium]MDX5463115.1 RIP metalloprotease RseP [Alphaproteobacteria bacterium]